MESVTPGFAIRDGVASDADVVAGIAVEAWRPICAHSRDTLGAELFAHLHTDCEAEKARQVRQACEDASRGSVLIATVGDVVVGFVSYHMHAAPVGVIGNNAVRPEYQSRGIATRLYEATLDRGSIQKCGGRSDWPV